MLIKNIDNIDSKIGMAYSMFMLKRLALGDN